MVREFLGPRVPRRQSSRMEQCRAGLDESESASDSSFTCRGGGRRAWPEL